MNQSSNPVVNNQEPTVIGIIGGIASGKSQVTTMLAEMGARIISADSIAHDVLRLPDIIESLVKAFGHGILTDASMDTSTGVRTIDRKKLGAIVFGSNEATLTQRKMLESIVHPRIRQIARSQLELVKLQADCYYIVLDAPLLVEGGWLPYCDRIIYVDTPNEVRLQRAKARGWSELEWQNRESAQLSLDQKRKCSTDVLPNKSSLDQLKQDLLRILDSWRDKTFAKLFMD